MNHHLEKLVEVLRDNHRIKIGIDYAYTIKYNELHIVCDKYYIRCIQDEADNCGVTIKNIFGY